MELKRVYATKDNEGHWYVIPYEQKSYFFELLEISEDDSEDNYEQHLFEEKFSQYMTGGDLNLVELYAEI